MIEVKIFDGECIAKIGDGYSEDFLKLCADYQTANIHLYHLIRNEAGNFYTVKISVPHGDITPFLTHCRQRHNVKII